ncbi:MAG: sigma-54-dependent Fis family transcriptional regulator [Gammaproteobacteria bacterium]|nr:sigma-54-dependent Fis family transcriptional regulator [Gammaproteobacteria bacterium]
MQANNVASQHASLVEATLRGEGQALTLSQDVRRSWQRCRVRYALDPATLRKPQLIDRNELKMRRETLGSLMPIAHIEMVELCRQMLHSGFGVMLTDRDGVIVNYVGDPGFADIARRSGFREGAVWSEEVQGTNGMGTCLVLRRPVLIHEHEHFLAQNTGLTCSAAPIFDPEGQLLAALDISGRASAAQTLTLAMVNIAALNIENRVLLDGCRHQFVLRFHRRPEFVSTSGEGLLAIDDQGIVRGANRCALDLLGHPEHGALCGHSIEEILDTTTMTLIQLASRTTFHPEAVRGRLNGNRLFFAVQGPERLVVRSARQSTAADDEAERLGLLAFGDPAMAQNVRVAKRVANRDISILLLGETGTGKGYFAKAIHAISHRASGPFISVNCAAIPETLIESELFGYEPGAFTGATRSGHMGRIVQASRGTLFLDEIGDMPLPLQVRLLSVIEDHEVLPLGGSKPIPVDVRIISATHRNLADAVASGAFRDDLYYRLNGIAITLPPLRSRGDKSALIQRLLRLEVGDGEHAELDDALLSRLLQYSWPGNLRQLRNVIRSMLALREGDRMTLADLQEDWLSATAPISAAATSAAPAPKADGGAEDDDLLGCAEREALLRILHATHWNVSAAAARLRLSRKTMYRKMHRHGIQREPAQVTVLAEHRAALSGGKPPSS